MKTITLNIKQVVLTGIITILLVLGGLYYYSNKVGKLKQDIESEVKIRTALLDTITTYTNKNNELVSEKKTIQADRDQLKSINNQLTLSQKNLLKRVDEVNKKNIIITAALLKVQVKLDSIMNGSSVVDDTANTVTFFSNIADNNVDYELLATNVKQYDKDIKPTLKFVKFDMINSQFVEFHWDKKSRDNYPISFSVSNSNKYFTIVNIDSYAIPELQKEVVKPSFWNKLGTGFKVGSKYTIGVGVGVGLGFLLFK